jgi:hypothetical protein
MDDRSAARAGRSTIGAIVAIVIVFGLLSHDVVGGCLAASPVR